LRLRLSRSAATADRLSSRQKDAAVTASALKQRIREGIGRGISTVIAVAALCAAVAGCVSDIAATPSDKADGTGQLRYYGGPKSPMWSGQ